MTTIDRSLAPRRGVSTPMRFPELESRSLASGPTLRWSQQPHIPIATVQVVLPMSPAFDPMDGAGMAAFTADLLEEGTEERSSTDIADTIERLGGYLASGAGWSSSAITVSALSRHLEPALELLGEVATGASFPDEEVERLRRERLADLARLRDRSAALAQAAWNRAVYGDTPYGRSIIGGEGSVKAMSAEEARGFYRRHSRPAALSILAVGDLDETLLEAIVEDAFGDASRDPGSPPDWPHLERPSVDGTRVVVVDRPQASQTDLRIGHAGVERNHPDRTRLIALDTMLGGKFTSRINLNLRERHGFTYGASCSFAQRRGPGPFLVSTAISTENAGAATREVIGELRRVREEPIPRTELDDTVSYLRGVLPYRLQTLNGVLLRLQTITVFGLPDDYHELQQRELGELETEDLERAARAHIDPENLVIVAAGPASELVSQLEELGPVEVLEAASLWA